MRAERHHALLVALAQAAHQAALRVDVGLAQADELRGPQTTPVQELDHGQITLPGGAGRTDLAQDRLDLRHAKHLG